MVNHSFRVGIELDESARVTLPSILDPILRGNVALILVDGRPQLISLHSVIAKTLKPRIQFLLALVPHLAKHTHNRCFVNADHSGCRADRAPSYKRGQHL